MSVKPTAFVLVGLPASGKSHWAHNHPEKYPVASTDAFIERVAAEQGRSYGDVFREAFPQAQAAMKAQVEAFIAARQPFIWDQTNLTCKEREAIYRLLHPTHEVVYVCFLVPLEVCLKRFDERERDGGAAIDRQRVVDLAKIAVFPDTDEPHDKIVRLKHPEWKE